ncbi:MAG: ABC transporter permease [Planctomycetes bacterium]|nr:ABC transporter permease [Planctomycetota bacterium]
MNLFEDLLSAAVRIFAPVLLLTLGEILVERAGVIDIGLEGLLLTGAFAGYAGSLLAGSPWVGLVAAMLASTALALLFAALVVPGKLDQIVCGVGVNLFAIGITGLLYRAIAEHAQAAGSSLRIEGFRPIEVPLLSAIPIVGPALFRQTGFAYAAYVLLPLVGLFLYRTHGGLLVRAAGENPRAVDVSGHRVGAIRVACLAFSGALAGVAGAYLSTANATTFVEGMSGGRGFVALGLVVFARWNPWASVLGALLYWFAEAFQIRFQGTPIFGVEIPYQFLQMLPFVLTLVVLATVRGRRTAAYPAALGKAYVRE